MIEKNSISNAGGDRSTSSRIVGLDIMRIALAILIYMFHSIGHIGCNYSFLTDFASVGAIAMTGFFLLSGYALRLVYGDSDIMEKRNLARFYFKRLISVLPLYYATAIIYIFSIGEESTIDNLFLLPIEALGLQSTFSSLFEFSHNDGTWFISCILLAYFVYPLLQSIVKQLALKHKVILLLILMAIDIWAVVISHRFEIARTYDNPFYRIIEFTCGIIVADMNIEYDNKWICVLRNKWVLICTSISLIVGVSLMRHYLTFGDYMLYNVLVLPCTAIMLFSLGSLRMLHPNLTKIVTYMGKISYAFFLVQFFAWPTGLRVIECIGYDSNFIRIATTFTFCCIASVVMYELVQKPIVKLISQKIV